MRNWTNLLTFSWGLKSHRVRKGRAEIFWHFVAAFSLTGFKPILSHSTTTKDVFRWFKLFSDWLITFPTNFTSKPLEAAFCRNFTTLYLPTYTLGGVLCRTIRSGKGFTCRSNETSDSFVCMHGAADSQAKPGRKSSYAVHANKVIWSDGNSYLKFTKTFPRPNSM